MKKSENSTDKIMQNIALIIFIAAYVGICGFVIVKINGERRSELINSQFTGEELIKKQAILQSTAGILAQIQVLLSAFIVLAVPKKGYICSFALNFVYAISCINAVIRSGNYGIIPGTIIPIATIFLISIINIFSNKLNQKNNEISKNYEKLMETNRIIKDKDEKLTYLAYYDILTSLPNRHLFIEKIDETIVNNSNMPFTVVLADLDDFKLINNNYGSSAGDTVLATYAEKFKILCGENVFLGRIGGNEYGFILQGNLSEANILNFIEKVQTILSEPVQIGNDIISATASFGIASYPNNALNSSDILNCINSAVSFAKSNGKNRPCFYEQY